jgi:hypothetical protein
MHQTLKSLLERLDDPALARAKVISWGAPVPAFGDLSRSNIATLGLNPSNREFVDIEGNELDGHQRRFHTLKSLGITRWSNATPRHLQLISESCRKYFHRNPYDGWFRDLDRIISGANASYYGDADHACHLDLIPYATACKWTELTAQQRSLLLDLVGDTLGLLLRDSPIRLLVLNGKTVIGNLEKVTGVRFDRKDVPDWTLPRKAGKGVIGTAYTGVIREIAGIRLNRDVAVLGYNHNIQSSFGVTSQVKASIRTWIARSAVEVFS